ncbi:MAG: glycosyltransferase [Deltaproteobacteria bacterium]|nr:glycosyltransferase [Deltaproteobacteria bacterium]
MSRHAPTISIITAAKNALTPIRACVESVQQQDYPAEHIIVVGSPKDRTAKALENDFSSTATILYEPDSGIYDAMNRGLAATTGEVIATLNADDFYAHGRVLSRAAEVFKNRSMDSCYGDLVYVAASNPSKVVRYWKSTPYRKELLYKGWMPPHPTFFARRSIYEKHGGFNPNLGTSADYELMLRFFMRNHICAEYIPEVMVIMRNGGQSNSSLRNRIKANRMDKMAWRINGLKAKPWTFMAKPLLKIGQYFFKNTTPWKGLPYGPS